MIGPKIPDVAIYFANESRDGEGALMDMRCYGYRKNPSGHKSRRNSQEDGSSPESEMTLPLEFRLIFPSEVSRFTQQKSCKSRQPVYVAQMDLRVDLSEVWDHLQEHERPDSHFRKARLASRNV